tara:strand:+ start:1059 stop:1301 length:243 start_codon:yes stop_codon:yes gene_type:complete
MKQVVVPEEQSRVGVIWVALNSVNFTGNKEAVREHRRLLLEYRRKIAKIEQCRPDQVESEMLTYYNSNARFLKKRGLELM